MHNGRDTEQVRAQIETTRARMGETIEELGERLNPDRVRHEIETRARGRLRDAKDAVRTATIGRMETMMNDAEREASRAGRSVLQTIKDNPVPAAMAGFGLAWLVANRSHASSYPEYRGRTYHAAGPMYAGVTTTAMNLEARRAAGGYGTARTHAEITASPPEEEAMTDRARHAAGDVADKGRELADTTREKASEAKHRVEDAAHRVQDKARDAQVAISHAADDARERADRLAHEARVQASRIEHRVEDAARDNPLAVGAVALALGFAAGMLVPETRQEDRMMGPTRDRLLDEAEDFARSAGEKARRVASEKAGEAASEIVAGGRAGGETGRASTRETLR